MSYCRWSSDDFSCDVYVYAGANEYVTHVAGNRAMIRRDDLPEVPDEPEGGLPDADDEWWVRYFARHEEVMRRLKDCERVPIDLEHAGDSFYDATPGDCADRLESLRALGYSVPQYAIDELREEQAAARSGDV